MCKLLLAILMTSSSLAFAGSPCTIEPKEKWIDKAEFERKLVEKGYKIKVFKITKKNCYELYGNSKDGKVVEIYFNPVTGDEVQQF